MSYIYNIYFDTSNNILDDDNICKPTYNSLNNKLSQSDIIQRNKTKSLFCNTNIKCEPLKNTRTYNYNDLYLYYKIIHSIKKPTI